MSKTEKMLAEWLEFLDDEDGKLPFPEWVGETGWVEHDDGSLEDWGIYLLRLAHDEIAALKAGQPWLKGATTEHLLQKEIAALKRENGRLREGWANLSDLVRHTYDYTEYCGYCELTVLRGVGHAEDCKLHNALLQEPFTGGTVSAYFDTSRESE